MDGRYILLFRYLINPPLILSARRCGSPAGAVAAAFQVVVFDAAPGFLYFALHLAKTVGYVYPEHPVVYVIDALLRERGIVEGGFVFHLLAERIGNRQRSGQFLVEELLHVADAVVILGARTALQHYPR